MIPWIVLGGICWSWSVGNRASIETAGLLYILSLVHLAICFICYFSTSSVLYVHGRVGSVLMIPQVTVIKIQVAGVCEDVGIARSARLAEVVSSLRGPSSHVSGGSSPHFVRTIQETSNQFYNSVLLVWDLVVRTSLPS